MQRTRGCEAHARQACPWYCAAYCTHLWGGGSEVEDCGREEEHEGDAAPRHLRKEGALKPRQALHDEWLVSRLSPVPGGASTSRARDFPIGC